MGHIHMHLYAYYKFSKYTQLLLARRWQPAEVAIVLVVSQVVVATAREQRR